MLCEKHYARFKRTGSTDLVSKDRPETKKHSSGYTLRLHPNHKLSSGGYVYEHRLVFYEHQGDGPFVCNWCNCDLNWSNIEIDHINSVKDDNRIENLVASCHPCNTKRGTPSMRRAIRNKVGITLDGITRTKGEWADRLGVSVATISWRLKNGWSIRDSLTTPRGNNGPDRLESNLKKAKERIDRETPR